MGLWLHLQVKKLSLIAVISPVVSQQWSVGTLLVEINYLLIAIFLLMMFDQFNGLN